MDILDTIEWIKHIPLGLLERVYKKCQGKDIAIHVGVIEALNDWLDKD